MLAKFSRAARWKNCGLHKAFLKALGMIALPFVLILKEPDLGSALVFFPIGLVMMFVAGVPLRYLASSSAASRC